MTIGTDRDNEELRRGISSRHSQVNEFKRRSLRMNAVQQLTPDHPNITRVENMSDFMANRMRIHFKNGYQLSVIRGYGTYGSRADLFEIAVIDAHDAWVPFEDGDTVMGWQTREDVISWINKVAVM